MRRVVAAIGAVGDVRPAVIGLLDAEVRGRPAAEDEDEGQDQHPDDDHAADQQQTPVGQSGAAALVDAPIQGLRAGPLALHI